MKTHNPDHNLWNNNGTFWCRFSVHYPDYTAGRIAKPLHTRDLIEARLRRDEIMKSTPGAVFPELEFSPSHEPQRADLAGVRCSSPSKRTTRKPRMPISKRPSTTRKSSLLHPSTAHRRLPTVHSGLRPAMTP